MSCFEDICKMFQVSINFYVTLNIDTEIILLKRDKDEFGQNSQQIEKNEASVVMSKVL